MEKIILQAERGREHVFLSWLYAGMFELRFSLHYINLKRQAEMRKYNQTRQ